MTVALVKAAHAGPCVAVTLVAALLTVPADLGLGTALAVTASVLAGQLTIGWGNDLLDAERDRLVGRRDKPLAAGLLTARTVQVAVALAVTACLVLAPVVGWRSASVNLVLGAGSGLLYNLGLKATAWSWAPYAVAFGTLPAVVTLAESPPSVPSAQVTLAAAALGVGAHFLNVLPDLADDAATGIRGLPHRLGPRAARSTATLLLLVASVAAVTSGRAAVPGWAPLALLVAVALAGVALLGSGKAPFYAAVSIAVLDVVLLTLTG